MKLLQTVYFCSSDHKKTEERTLEKLTQHVESLIFATDAPIGLADIQLCLENVFGMQFPRETLLEAINDLKARYAQDEFSFEVVEISEGYQFMSKGAYHVTIGQYLKQTTQRRLSKSAMEVLSIIAYKQPITKSEVEKIRGVNCDYAIQKLLEKELIAMTGRSDGPGKPLLYATSDKFMDYFGLKSMKDLPQPKEFKVPENMIGQNPDLEDEPMQIAEQTTDVEED